MRRSGVGSGGGYGMNKHSDVRAPKVEPRARAKAPGGVAQIGGMVGNHITSTVNTNYRGEDLERGPGYANPVGPTSFGKVGVGAARDIHPAGGQGTHGAVNRGNPPAQRGDILSQYGPESKRS